MGYNTPPTKATDNGLSIGEWNRYLVDNWQAMVPDVFTAKGQIFSGSGADTGAVSAGTTGQVMFADSEATGGLTWSIPALVGAYMPNNSAKNISATTWTQIDKFTTESFDTAAAYSSSTFTAPHPGAYLIIVGLLGSDYAAENSAFIGGIYVNDVLYSHINKHNGEKAYADISGVPTALLGADILFLGTGDTVKFYVYMGASSQIYEDADDLSPIIRIIPLL